MKVVPKCLVLILTIGALVACSRSQTQASNQVPVELRQQLSVPFKFVAYGDTRFTDPKNTDASNPEIRRALVQAIGDARPAFISIGGDVSFNGFDPNDWKEWDSETSVWREKKIPVYPAIGNHELRGDEAKGLANYFQRFPELKNSRYYSVLAANTLTLVLDSAFDETTGPQGQWLTQKLDNIPGDVDFVFVVLHHPPYTSSSDDTKTGGHSARSPEQQLAKLLETRQTKMRARIVVFAGHVHNYERHEHGGITYFVTGGGGAHPYLIQRAPDDLFKGDGFYYHYLLAEVDHQQVKITMNRLQLEDGKQIWTQPDSVTIKAVAAKGVAAGTQK